MDLWLVTAILFGILIFSLALGIPISFALAGIAVIFTFFFWGSKGLIMIFSSSYDKGTEFILVALPLFVLMANFLEVSGIAEDLYGLMYRWVGNIPGGLASGTVIICAIFAAMAGISGVATVTMGLIAIPSMLKRKYDKRLAVGTVAAGGALGVLIPPSIIAIIFGSVAGISVGKLFIGGVVPGITLSIIFIIYITIQCVVNPKLGPSIGEKFSVKEKIMALKAIIFPLVLIFLVLGSIFSGAATPTESAGVGALGAIIACIINRRLTWKSTQTALLRTLAVSSMCMWIVFGATCFSRIYSAIGASQFMTHLVTGLPVSPTTIIWFMMIIYIILGCFIDPAGMCLITVPVFLPIVTDLGFDPLWFGILFIVNTEMAFLTPPFGFNLFYLKAIVPKDITMGDIYRSITPFVACQFICLVLVLYIPDLAVWLPNQMISSVAQ